MKVFALVILIGLIFYSCHISKDVKIIDDETLLEKEVYTPVFQSDCYDKCDTCYCIRLKEDWPDTLRYSWAAKVKFPSNAVTITNKNKATTFTLMGATDTPDYKRENETISQESVVSITGDTLNMFGSDYIVKGDTLFPIRYGQYIYVKEKK